MDIKKDYIERLLEKFKKVRERLLRPDVLRCDRFKKIDTPEGQIIYTTIGNTQGWWSVVYMYEDAKRVEVYDMHVFERYQDRFLRKKVYDKKKLVSEFLGRNSSGTIYIEPGNKFSKKIKDGACLGDLTEDLMIIHNKTFISEDQVDPRWQGNLC